MKLQWEGDLVSKGERCLKNFLLDIKKSLLLRCINHFESDLINNMDHMRISDTEPSSVILSQTKLFKKLKIDAQKCRTKLNRCDSKERCSNPTSGQNIQIIQIMAYTIRPGLLLV